MVTQATATYAEMCTWQNLYSEPPETCQVSCEVCLTCPIRRENLTGLRSDPQ